MQGLYIDYRRPKSKREVKEIVASAPDRVTVEATSVFGSEFHGLVTKMTVGQEILFVGPDPHTSRKFYGKLIRTVGGFKVS
jgi:hypothetical protein